MTAPGPSGLLGHRRRWVAGVLAAAVVGGGWLVTVTLDRPSEGTDVPTAAAGQAPPVTVAAGTLYGRAWSMTVTRDAAGGPCFQLHMKDRSGRALGGPGCDPVAAVPLKAGEWEAVGLDGSRIVLAFGVAGPGVVRYELVSVDGTRVPVTPVAYGGVQYFGFAYPTDQLAHYVRAVVGYDAAGRRVVDLDPMSNGGTRPVPRPAALGAPAATIGSGVIDGVAWRAQELPPRPEATYAAAGFIASPQAPPSGLFHCELLTAGGRHDAGQCGSWPPTVILYPHMPINGPCRQYGVPTVCVGTVDPRVDRLDLVLADGSHQTPALVTFHGYRFTAFAFPTDHPARSLTAYDNRGAVLARTDQLVDR